MRWSKKKSSKWPTQKTSFSSSASSQYFFMKISWIFCFITMKTSSLFIWGLIFFLHYGWFLQNLGKDFIQTNMHMTVALCVSSGNAFLTLYYGQFDNHIGCASSMSFTSIYSINNSRINPWKVLRMGGFDDIFWIHQIPN